MVRPVLALLVLVAAACAAPTEDKDPIKDKLLAANAAYDKEMEQYHKQVIDWLEKREETARKDGNKKLLDQVKADRKAFDEDGLLPSTAPAALKQKHDRARKALDAAYAEAVKAYTKAKKDEEAASVEEAWKAFKEGGAIDLLALVDPKTHAVVGDWKKDGKALVGATKDRQARLQLPYEPGEEYDLEVTCRRVAGEDCFCLGLVAGGRQVLAVIDGWSPDHVTGFDLVDKKHAPDNATTVKGQFLKPDKDHAVTCSVRSGRIDIVVNGKTVTSFRGEFSRLALDEGHRVPNEKALFLYFGPGASFQVDRIVVKPVQGKGTILK
jgi:hypothetical protein